MDSDKAKKAAFEYAYYFQEMFSDYQPKRFEAQAIRPEVHEAIEHIMWMANEMQSFTSEGKVMRWLGFIQGSMWVLGSKSIAELKEDNMSMTPYYEPPPKPQDYSINELANAYELFYEGYVNAIMTQCEDCNGAGCPDCIFGEVPSKPINKCVACESDLPYGHNHSPFDGKQPTDKKGA